MGGVKQSEKSQSMESNLKRNTQAEFWCSFKEGEVLSETLQGADDHLHFPLFHLVLLPRKCLDNEEEHKGSYYKGNQSSS